jgi:hypothetical protein
LQTPVLANAQLLSAYRYLDESNAVYCPDDIDAIEAIARLRRHGTTLSATDALRAAAYSWPKDQEYGDAALDEIYDNNERNLQILLAGSK